MAGFCHIHRCEVRQTPACLKEVTAHSSFILCDAGNSVPQLGFPACSGDFITVYLRCCPTLKQNHPQVKA